MKKRFALILGGPHAGTTRLFGRLGRHSQVLRCRVIEPHFFTDDRKWQLGLDWYRSLWDFREPDERVAIEASNDYARHPIVSCPAERVARTPAGFRFVYLMREPVTRVAAWHAARVAAGFSEPVADLRELATELAASRYACQLAAWREHFPAEDFLLVASEEWAEAPDAVFQRVCRFLEIDPSPRRSGGAAEARPGRRLLPGRLTRWLGRPGARPRCQASPADGGLPSRVVEALERELAGERERLAAEWGFAPTWWLRREGE